MEAQFTKDLDIFSPLTGPDGVVFGGEESVGRSMSI